MAFRKHDDELRESPTAFGPWSIGNVGEMTAPMKSIEDLKLAAAQSFGAACAPNPFVGTVMVNTSNTINVVDQSAYGGSTWQHMVTSL